MSAALRELVEREERAWLESIRGDNTQGDCLYKPGRVIQARICLALMDGEAYDPPLSYSRAEILVDWLTADADCRRGNSFDVTPRRFAEGHGIIADWTGGAGEVGDRAVAEWGGEIAIVWWRPHGTDSLLCEYRPGRAGVWLDVDRWGNEVVAVGGPPVPNNRCDPPHRYRLMLPWSAAGERQLDLFAAA